MAGPSKRLKAFVFVVAVVLGGALLVAGLVFAIREARQAARLQQYSRNMQDVGRSLLAFESDYGRLPPAVHRDGAGRPLCSWRLRLVTFLEGIMREIEYDEPWDAPVNEWISGSRFYCFCWLPGEEGVDTNVVAITGPGTAFEEGHVVRLKDIAPDTILAIEIAKSDIRWAEPRDLDIEHVSESITRGVEGRGVHVIFADGAVWFLRADVPLEQLKKFFTIECARRGHREQVLRPYAL
jgi:hypothetical protein